MTYEQLKEKELERYKDQIKFKDLVDRLEAVASVEGAQLAHKYAQSLYHLMFEKLKQQWEEVK